MSFEAETNKDKPPDRGDAPHSTMARSRYSDAGVQTSGAGVRIRTSDSDPHYRVGPPPLLYNSYSAG